ncbi:MAG TPA: hypothetical protein VG479_04145 [Gaiellaceae bacterium]|jgi:hypothetical protein|nr:hypothetical protein [Gaiellaceae bacterium]
MGWLDKLLGRGEDAASKAKDMGGDAAHKTGDMAGDAGHKAEDVGHDAMDAGEKGVDEVKERLPGGSEDASA